HPAVEPILRRVAETSASPALRREACEALREASGRGAIVALRGRMERDEDPAVRAVAARMLASLGLEEMLAPMVELARAQGADHRLAAAGVLRQHDGPRARQLLPTLLDDPDETVRLEALDA